MVGCQDCIHYEVCDYRDPAIYGTIQDLKNDCRHCIPASDVVPRAEVEELYKEIDRLSQVVLYNDSVTEMKVDEAKTEVARTFRKRMNEKMGKHTHLLGKEYVQRIMREVEKELIGE
jgi:hypothetical protein